MVYLPNQCPLVAMGSTRNIQESATLHSPNNQTIEEGQKRAVHFSTLCKGLYLTRSLCTTQPEKAPQHRTELKSGKPSRCPRRVILKTYLTLYLDLTETILRAIPAFILQLEKKTYTCKILAILQRLGLITRHPSPIDTTILTYGTSFRT